MKKIFLQTVVKAPNRNKVELSLTVRSGRTVSSASCLGICREAILVSSYLIDIERLQTGDTLRIRDSLQMVVDKLMRANKPTRAGGSKPDRHIRSQGVLLIPQ